MVARLRGHADTRIDEKGRLKMPAAFKRNLEGAYGNALFITALTNAYLQIFPLPIWEEIEGRVNALGSMHPLRLKFLTRANRFGTEVEMDAQGRVLLKQSQRAQVGIQEDVVLIGCTDNIQVWPSDKLAAIEGEDTLTPEDFSTLGI